MEGLPLNWPTTYHEADSTLPLVSIITPCFNSVAFIEMCIESVLAQTYPRVEHIVQDGASTDGTVEILQHYTGRIDWVSEPDHGQADGLDKAIKRSHGEILLVLNGDDILLPGAASWAVQGLAENQTAAVVYGDEYLINEAGHTIGTYVAPEYDFESMLCVEQVLPAQAAFIRRSALEQVGFGADVTLDSCPDYEMFVRLGLKFPMRHVPGFVAKYRRYNRPLEGTKPRTADLWMRAKAGVMERVFDNCADREGLKRLRRRARAGLLLWTSQEARAMGDSSAAWKYYLEALSQFGMLGRALAVFIRFLSRLRGDQPTRKKEYRTSPSWPLALATARRLFVEEFPLVRPALRLIRVMSPIFQIAVNVAVLVLIAYLLFTWKPGH